MRRGNSPHFFYLLGEEENNIMNLQNASIAEIQSYIVNKSSKVASDTEYTKQFLRHVNKIRMIENNYRSLEQNNAKMLGHLKHVQNILNTARNIEKDGEISIYKTIGVIYSDKRSEIQELDILQQHLNSLSALSMEGYKEILAFKQFLTGQELKYAIKDKTTIYQISENKYLELWGTNLTTWQNKLSGIKYGTTTRSFNFIKDAKIILNNSNKALHNVKGLNIKADPLYKTIEETYAKRNDKGQVNNNGRLWELYTQTKYSVLNLGTTQRISQALYDSKEDDILKFMKDYVSSIYFKDTDAFYKTGDTARDINGAKQMMENKEISKGASINVNTIRNGISSLNTVFHHVKGTKDINLLAKQLNKYLNTATPTVGDKIGVQVYGKAAEEAQENIVKSLERLTEYNSKNGAKVKMTVTASKTRIEFFNSK